MPNASNIEYEDLSNRIYNVFSEDHLYPGDKNIVRDKFPPAMPDPLEVFELYHGKTWQELDDGFFLSHGAIQFSISWLTLQAIYYYLPSFMRHIISPCWGDNDTILLDKLLEVIYPNYNAVINLKQYGAIIPHQAEVDTRKEFEFLGISKEKIKAINYFFRYLFENERYASNVKYLEESDAVKYWT